MIFYISKFYKTDINNKINNYFLLSKNKNKYYNKSK